MEARSGCEIVRAGSQTFTASAYTKNSPEAREQAKYSFLQRRVAISLRRSAARIIFEKICAISGKSIVIKFFRRVVVLIKFPLYLELA
jgi:hypothetical protein